MTNPWTPPEAAPAHRPRRWLRNTLVVVVIAVPVILAGMLWWQNRDLWRSLRTEATQFTPPAGWETIGSVEEGTALCIISCNGARVTVVYHTAVTPARACDQLRAAVEQQIGPAPIGPDRLLCGWYAPLPAVGDRAAVIGNAERAAGMGGESAPVWADEISVPDTGTVVELFFNSGID